MGMIGGWELLLIFFIVLLVFGAKRLPEIAKSMGKSVQECKKAKEDILNFSEDDKKQKSAVKNNPSPVKELAESSTETK